jgi:ribose transport system permease protein
MLLGALNGVLVAWARIPSFIVTLAGLIAYRGVALMFNKGSPVFSVDPAFDAVFYGRLFGVPLPCFYLVTLYGAAAVMMVGTRIGREIMAVGGNPAAARLSGIQVQRVQTIAFTMAGGMTAIGAILMSARLNSGSPNYGQTLELQAIAAAVVGGASLAGGRGNILATLIGSLTIVIVQNGLNLNAAPSAIQNVILGLIILLAVGIDMWRPQMLRFLRRIAGRGSLTQVSVASTPRTPQAIPEKDNVRWLP